MFSYQISDGRGGGASGTLAILITAVDDSLATSLDANQTSFDGNSADENITGNSTNNAIRGFGGDGEGGNDTLMGGDGNDHIYGNSLGGAGNATDGADMIDAGAGGDYVNGNGGNDTIIGGVGNDRLMGGRDNGSISGGDGQDPLNGNLGNDTISAGDGNDRVRGGQDDDVLRGDGGNDIVMGDIGNDTLFAGAGVDLLTGGAGSDLFDFSEAGAGNFDLANFYTAITDFEQGIDHIRLGFAVGSGQVLQGGSFASVAAAQGAAGQQLTAHAGTQDVFAAQVGTDTFLFYNAAGTGNQVTGIIEMFGTTATAIEQADFVF